jgi:hypothetical protein
MRIAFMKFVFTSILVVSILAAASMESLPEYISFTLNGQSFTFVEGITPRPLEPSDDDPELLIQEAQENSSAIIEDKAWVQIIRQNDKWNPTQGIAIGFEFDPTIDTFPYLSAKAAIQFKDFKYGGQHFSKKDTANYSGLFNDYNAEIRVEILDFQSDTIVGKFSGVLLSGSGKMAHLDDGNFRIRLYRQ